MNPVRPYWHYCYVLRSRKNGEFYTGTTSNLALRIKQHNRGFGRATKHNVPLKLIYFEAYLSRGDAYRREKYLKSGMGKRDLKKRLRGGLTG